MLYDEEKVLDMINEAERRFPVDRWKVDNIYIWPIIRLRWFLGLAGGEPPQDKLNKKIFIFNPIITFLKICYVWARTSWRDRKKNIWRPFVKADILFWIRSSERHALPDRRKYHIYCDPLIPLIQKRGLSSLMWEAENSDGYRTPRYSPSFFIEPWIVFQKWRWKQKNKMTMDEIKQFEQYAEFLEFVRESGGNTDNLESKKIIDTVRFIRFLTNQIKKILIKVRPACVFSASLDHGSEAINLACYELGILSVNIQHGVTGEDNFVYTRWNRVPRQGFNLLPACYWCWDTQSAEVIGRWTKQCPGIHQTVVGGNVWYKVWNEMLENNSLWEAYAEPMQIIKKKVPAKTHVLLSLQPPQFLYRNRKLFPDFVAEAMRLSFDEIFWWIRIHPRMEPSIPIKELKIKNLKNIEWEIATSASLPLLLSNVDVHVSACSTVTLDAEALGGIASVAWMDINKKLFPKQYNSGRIKLVQDTESLLCAIKTQAQCKTKPTEKDTVCAESAMEQVLSKADLLKNQFEHNKNNHETYSRG